MSNEPSTSGYQFLSSERPATPQITLRDAEGGGLTVEKPTTDLVRGGNHVIWCILNESRTEHTVALTNFRVKASGSEWPFDPPGPKPDPTVTVGPNQIKRIRLKTKTEGPNGKHGAWVYAYDIVVDGTPQEPEIIVEWP